MIKIGVTGYNGLLGKYLVGMKEVKPIKANILKEDQLKEELQYIDVLIHAAALTSVDYCEKHPDEAFGVNVRGTANIVNICSESNIQIIFISTDHVFSGKPRMFSPNENTKPSPINIYGLTKYAAEAMVNTSDSRTIIVRTSKLINGDWLYENGLCDLKSGKEIDTPKFISKSFLHAQYFADALLKLPRKIYDFEYHGLINITSAYHLSYYELWSQVCAMEGIDANLLVGRTIKFDGNELAPRPFRGGLDARKAQKMGIIEPLSTQKTLELALREYHEKYSN